ncbi:MAG: hypothetical protein CME36_13760 [unclassified Hahellaceae]|nr:hypothetical protein [Hahellaceae bacterium]
MIRLTVTIAFLILIVSASTAGHAVDSLTATDTKIGEDVWTEITMEGRGLIVKNNEGSQILQVDKFGGIYINGHLYINNNKFDAMMLDNAVKLSESSRILTRATLLNIALAIVISVAISVFGRRATNKL